MTQLHKDILNLKQGTTKYGPAPHKPVLLLAVISLFEEGKIYENWIEPSEELVVAFHDTWNIFVNTDHSPTFALPFYHLNNEKSGIWNLHTFPGKTVQLTSSKSIKSYTALSNTYAAATLEEDLYSTLTNPQERLILKELIIRKYFPDISISSEKSKYSEEITKEILYDPSNNYAKRLRKKIENLDPEIKEQEIIIRSHIFRKIVLDIYDNQCAISGLKVQFKNKYSLIDACHITPFASSHDDTIINGIALSPNLHRAFDKGIIAISNDYTVLLHKNASDLSSQYSIEQFDKKMIHLPNNPVYYPDLERLKDHRIRFGFE